MWGSSFTTMENTGKEEIKRDSISLYLRKELKRQNISLQGGKMPSGIIPDPQSKEKEGNYSSLCSC